MTLRVPGDSHSPSPPCNFLPKLELGAGKGPKRGERVLDRGKGTRTAQTLVGYGRRPDGSRKFLIGHG